MSRRVVEDILDKVVYGDNDAAPWFETAKPALDALRAEILSNAPLTAIPDDGGADVEAWNALLDAYPGSWLSAPWLVAEFYLCVRRADGIASTWIVRGDESRHRRGRDVDSPWRRVAPTPRVPCG